MPCRRWNRWIQHAESAHTHTHTLVVSAGRAIQLEFRAHKLKRMHFGDSYAHNVNEAIRWRLYLTEPTNVCAGSGKALYKLIVCERPRCIRASEEHRDKEGGITCAMSPLAGSSVFRLVFRPTDTWKMYVLYHVTCDYLSKITYHAIRIEF